MSRADASGPPTYVFVDASESSDRPQLSRGLTSAWDQGPSTGGTFNRFSTAQLRAERRHGTRQLYANPSAFEMSVDSDNPTNGSSSDPFPPRARRSFYIPSYLIGTRFARRLKQQHETELSEQQERAQRRSSGHRIGLPSSPSSTSLGKAAVGAAGTSSTYRGVAQRVVERFPELPEGDRPSRVLPSKWNNEDKSHGLEISGDGYDLRFSGHFKSVDEAASLRTDHPIPKDTGLYYYEVHLKSKGREGLIGLGLSRRSTNLARQPGWEAESFAYHGDDGSVYSGSSNGHAYGPKYSAGDVIGCGVNFRTNCIFFTKNGVFLGDAFKDVKTDRLYPTVGLRRSGEYLRLNLGQSPFCFDIDGMMRDERATVRASLMEEDVSKLSPPDDEQTLIRKLIAQFLAHEGYVETSKAFGKDLRTLQSLSPSEKGNTASLHDDTDDVHAIHRQKIRMAVLDGSIDRALKYMRTYYPRVLEDKQNRDIYFRLRCRRFIELMRQYSEATPREDMNTTNGHHHSQTEDPTQMALDDQLQRETSNGFDHSDGEDVDMDDPSDMGYKKSASASQGDLLSTAIEYGQSLRADFDSEAQTKTLDDIFALVAYPDPRDSPVGSLLDTSGRASIAEDLNGIILVSLGKPRSAALEKVYAQTNALLDLTAFKVGGDAAFVNLDNDIL